MRIAISATACMLAILAGAVTSAHAARPTGRHLVIFERASVARSPAAVSEVLARTGVTIAGRGVPELRIATVRGGPVALERLRRDPAVESVSVEWARDLRRTPNDPALSTPETEFTSGVPGGTPIQWALARERFPAAWDVTTGNGAIVGVIDSGVDGAGPELAGKIASADAVGTTDPLSDPDGHGTHVSGLACAATDNGLGLAGAGWGCRLAVVKYETTIFGDIPDEDIVDGIRVATDRGSHAINMSFGEGATTEALKEAVDYAVSRGVILVAAASNEDTAEQGAPAVELQPGNAPDLAAGRGLVVTAAEFDDTRAGTGFGPQVSLAAYGFFDEDSRGSLGESMGPPGLFSSYPADATPQEGVTAIDGCNCRRELEGDDRYAYLGGTSMAAPQVAALAAMVSELNPFLSLREKLTILKETARSEAWEPELGWGIIDAGRAVHVARRIDRRAPRSQARAARRVKVRRGARRARVRVRWSGSDPAGAPGLLPSGRIRYDVYVGRGKSDPRLLLRATRRRSAAPRLRPGVYRFFTRATDGAGNVEPRPRRPDARVVVRR